MNIALLGTGFMGKHLARKLAAAGPVLNDTAIWLDYRIWAEHDAGDHLIVLGKVEEMSLPDRRSEDPLLYFKGRYRQLSAK